ncbi:fibronectin type III domain-containing protein, partial [Candidatus Gracilibacteria bacterium]|nr:fibronectin type III domain-containing protein [Candidatus Gracilibacteria bacterium]
ADFIYLMVENFSDENSEVFFGEQSAEINAFVKNNEGGGAIVVEVPQLTEIGNYLIRIMTTDGMIESPDNFEITEIKIEAESKSEHSTATPEIEVTIPIEENLYFEGFEEENFGKLENLADSVPAENFYTPATAEIVIGSPQNLQATSTANGIELSWEKPTNGEIAFYNIYYGTKSGSYIHRVTSEDIYEIFSKNLTNGQYYFFVASAIDTNGNESGSSNETSAIYSPSLSMKTATSIFHAASPKPAQLSEEGPAATLLISVFITLALLATTFRRKIWSRF